MTEKNIDLNTVEQSALLAIKYILWAEEGFAGSSMTKFIDDYSAYSQINQLNNDKQVSNLITVMTQAQSKNDLLFVADILKYELIPYLKQLEARNPSI